VITTYASTRLHLEKIPKDQMLVLDEAVVEAGACALMNVRTSSKRHFIVRCWLTRPKESRADAVTRKKSPSRALWRRSHARDCIHRCTLRLTAPSRNSLAS